MKVRKLALKEVLQLDVNKKFVGYTLAQEHPYHEGEWMIPPDAIDISLPSNANLEKYDYYYIDNSWKEIKKPVEEKQETEEKEKYKLTDKQYARIYISEELDNAVVEVDGMKFQVNDDSLINIDQAIRYGNDYVDWILADNSVKRVSKDTLIKVMQLGVQNKITKYPTIYTDKSIVDLGKKLAGL